jgi:hypothetical protein
MTLGSLVDNVIMMIILLLAFDALRRVTFFGQPLQTVSFVLLCLGAFGQLMWNVGGARTHWWAISMHAGFAIYAVRVFGTGVFAAMRRGAHLPMEGRPPR